MNQYIRRFVGSPCDSEVHECCYDILFDKHPGQTETITILNSLYYITISLTYFLETAENDAVVENAVDFRCVIPVHHDTPVEYQVYAC